MSDTRYNEAWRAFEEGRLEDADHLWMELVREAPSTEERDGCRGGHLYVLVAQKRFEEARRLCQEVFERTGSHCWLHQLGMVEREAGRLGTARALFEQEAGLIDPGDTIAAAANLYERALVCHRIGDASAAREWMERCLVAASTCGDATTLGAAWRLNGDLLASRDLQAARDAWRRARRHFEQAGDSYGVREVEGRLKTAGE